MGSENKFEVLLIAELQKLIDKLESHSQNLGENQENFRHHIISMFANSSCYFSLESKSKSNC